jgi:hypothetical protein
MMSGWLQPCPQRWGSYCSFRLRIPRGRALGDEGIYLSSPSAPAEAAAGSVGLTGISQDPGR